MKDRAHVLVVDDEANVRKVLATLLEQAGHATTRAATAEEALALVRSHDPDLVLTDLRMPGMDGLELLSELRESFPEIPVVLLTAHGTVEAAVEAMKRGAHDFLTKPFDKDQVVDVVARALRQAETARDEFQGPLASGERCGIIGGSAAMQRVFEIIERVAPTPATVLVTGETGTGKELVAAAVHELSPRQAAPLVRVSCAALPDHLVESELFGHERGAFTGADRARPGRFALADGGTLFLDEIGEMPLASQVKLLRVLQDGVVDPLGSTKSVQVDVRLVAATNRDLDQAVADGVFRQDLTHRLRVVEIRLPSLAERRDDIPRLVDFFLDKHAGRLGVERRELSAAALEHVSARRWPGNVRELEHAVERALLLSQSEELQPADFEVASPASAPAEEAGVEPAPGALRAATAEAERRVIRAALEATAGNVTQAADRLGVSRRGLQVKMKALGLRE